ncbi:sulfotransferase family 2 domain-containing protein [Pseudooceanicola nanhaiensis]|uniref:sulfotransferase family 2 domain-containing protein n=1 Tax=Pseudooceanicola nanhaiensis TaxID=375761 RepID=UPI001CD1C5EF|nr:sulfotransferase family 2 domain-containing protein [Pseudooceanicola nanhaiensis]MCA0922806.1 sulfotransferase family protein [Pseudooceanicola nanhaiensis]
MAIIIDKHKFSFFFTPKVACTSIKYMCFEIENDRPFEPFMANGVMKYVHEAVYPGRRFQDVQHAAIKDHVRLAVVRDPIARFLSCYSNRVVHHKELSVRKAGAKLKQFGLKPDPTLEEFANRFGAYRKCSDSIRHHTAPMVNFLGKDPGYYENVYNLRDIGQCVERISQIVGRPLELGRHQTGGPKLSVDDLSPAQIDKLKQFYAVDYNNYGTYL